MTSDLAAAYWFSNSMSGLYLFFDVFFFIVGCNCVRLFTCVWLQTQIQLRSSGAKDGLEHLRVDFVTYPSFVLKKMDMSLP